MLLAVTGAAGFLGRNFVPVAVRAGHQVRALVRPGEIAPQGSEPLSGELANTEAIECLVTGAEVLVHLAALGVQSRDRDWQRTTQVNVVQSLALVESAARAGVRQVVAAGTCLEYSGHGRLPDAPWKGPGPPPLCDEKSSLETSDAYGATKAAGGLLLRARARSLGLPFWYLRFASMYGPGDDPDKFLPAAIRAAREQRPFEMTAGEQVREWLHVEDATRALLAVLDRMPDDDGLANVGTGEGIALGELVGQIFEMSGAHRDSISLGARPYRPDEVHLLVMDGSAFRQKTAWMPSVSFDEGLRRILEYQRCG